MTHWWGRHASGNEYEAMVDDDSGHYEVPADISVSQPICAQHIPRGLPWH